MTGWDQENVLPFLSTTQYFSAAHHVRVVRGITNWGKRDDWEEVVCVNRSRNGSTPVLSKLRLNNDTYQPTRPAA
ncbi:hypothetical protein CEXT_804871 [Caerostris extrusa]|uniref:Uncharacterized protein n=1 Tax=Caerostris extrusa TaxID=172846 RepID=A0AAV4MP81_CAEEX|nr:hypothetical protein CEXT_804871 [Caerostris extrusa]